MKKHYVNHIPHIPFKRQFNCISKYEKEVLIAKKMKQGYTKQEAIDLLKKENGFIIRQEKEKMHQELVKKEQEKTQTAKNQILDLIVSSNEQAHKKINQTKREFSYEEFWGEK